MHAHPNHVHPRHKRKAIPAPYRALHKPLVPVKAGASKARKAETYRGHPEWIAPKRPTGKSSAAWVDHSKYTAEKLREIRKVKGVGRPAIPPTQRRVAA
jgi:hypothetical protein